MYAHRMTRLEALTFHVLGFESAYYSYMARKHYVQTYGKCWELCSLYLEAFLKYFSYAFNLCYETRSPGHSGHCGMNDAGHIRLSVFA